MAERDPDFPDGLRQPDRRSCGAACLVVAEALARPAYAAQVSDPAVFRAETLAMHGRVTSMADASGRVQLPWPRALGTPPWAVARQLASTHRTHFRVVPLVRAEPEAAYDVLAGGGLPAALYVGNRWLPRHVVLVLEADTESMRVYEPHAGRVEWIPRSAVAGGRLGGWDVPWCAVVAATGPPLSGYRGRRTPA